MRFRLQPDSVVNDVSNRSFEDTTGQLAEEETISLPRPTFRVEQEPTLSNAVQERAFDPAPPSEPPAPPSSLELGSATASNPDIWRQEVAARVHRYKSRRQPRAPRYPSLALKFEPIEPQRQSQPAPPNPTLLEQIPEQPAPEPIPAAEPRPLPRLYPITPVEPAKVIEFPRPWVPPVRPVDELAEPVLDRPRIIEVPEVLPPPPAMGGILIEPAREPVQEKRPGFEIPLQSAPMSQRLFAAGIDAAIVVAALTAFGYVAFRFAGSLPPLSQTAELGLAMAVVLWAAYQYSSIVFSGSTIGLQVARLQLCQFDGTPATRRTRRWRALASLMSGFSLGLGYAWCFLDEDGLCWHDRITRTYMAPKHPVSTAAE